MAKFPLANLNIWRVPDFLFTARGYYLGDTDEFIGKIAKYRTIIGAAGFVFIAIAFPGFDRGLPSEITGVRQGSTAYNIFNYLGNWLQNALGAVVMSAVVLVPVSLLVVLMARSGAKGATLRQLRWPFITIGLFIGVLAGMAAAVGVLPLVTAFLGKRANGTLVVVINIVEVVIAIVMMVWLIKMVYLVLRDFFRADDGHPFLAPIGSTLAVWGIFLLNAVTSGDATGVPHEIAFIMSWGGPLTVTALNVWAIARIRKEHGMCRNGPLAA
jgi:hypothetical protein